MFWRPLFFVADMNCCHHLSNRVSSLASDLLRVCFKVKAQRRRRRRRRYINLSIFFYFAKLVHLGLRLHFFSYSSLILIREYILLELIIICSHRSTFPACAYVWLSVCVCGRLGAQLEMSNASPHSVRERERERRACYNPYTLGCLVCVKALVSPPQTMCGWTEWGGEIEERTRIKRRAQQRTRRCFEISFSVPCVSMHRSVSQVVVICLVIVMVCVCWCVGK